MGDETLGQILVDQGKLSADDVDRIVEYQRQKGLYFGEAAKDLGLLSNDDVLRALSRQFGYSYGLGDEGEPLSEMVMAGEPFGKMAEEFRSIRSKLLHNWLTSAQKVLAVVSPDSKDGRSFVAANLAQAFSQTGQSTLLIDADLRSPRQHEIFGSNSRIGLSVLLAGRVSIEELNMLPDRIPMFRHLSVLGCGAVPPNPAELLSAGRFPQILHELKKYFGVIIIDTPAASSYQSDVLSIASLAKSILLISRSGHSKVGATKALMDMLRQGGSNVVGAVLNQY